MFAFVSLERGLEWYRRLLMPSLPDNQQLNINPKNCIGTVLSINGYRKYFCTYSTPRNPCTPDSCPCVSPRLSGLPVALAVCY